MVGLATDAARFFKFLLIIVEFSIAMVLFVRPRQGIESVRSDARYTEFPPRLRLSTWRDRHPPQLAVQPLPNDLCRVSPFIPYSVCLRTRSEAAQGHH